MKCNTVFCATRFSTLCLSTLLNVLLASAHCVCLHYWIRWKCDFMTKQCRNRSIQSAHIFLRSTVSRSWRQTLFLVCFVLSWCFLLLFDIWWGLQGCIMLRWIKSIKFLNTFLFFCFLQTKTKLARSGLSYFSVCHTMLTPVYTISSKHPGFQWWPAEYCCSRVTTRGQPVVITVFLTWFFDIFKTSALLQTVCTDSMMQCIN